MYTWTTYSGDKFTRDTGAARIIGLNGEKNRKGILGPSRMPNLGPMPGHFERPAALPSSFAHQQPMAGSIQYRKAA